jgi:hypothetical protein
MISAGAQTACCRRPAKSCANGDNSAPDTNARAAACRFSTASSRPPHSPTTSSSSQGTPGLPRMKSPCSILGNKAGNPKSRLRYSGEHARPACRFRHPRWKPASAHPKPHLPGFLSSDEENIPLNARELSGKCKNMYTDPRFPRFPKNSGTCLIHFNQNVKEHGPTPFPFSDPFSSPLSVLDYRANLRKLQACHF